MSSEAFFCRTVTPPREGTHLASALLGARLLLILLGLILLCPAPATANPIGTVISLTPGVSVLRDGQTLPLALKDPVEAQDSIITDATGKAQIIFNDDSTVTLANSTNLDMSEFNYEDGNPGFKGHVGQGLVRVITGKIVEQNPDGFSITTPHATVGIRGTVLDVGVDENRTTVFVENTLHREVFVNNTQVPQGNKAIVDSAGAQPILQPLTPQDQNDLDTDATVATPVMTETAEGTPAAIPSPDSDLTSQNLPQQAMADNITPPAPPAVTIATVTGGLTPGPGGEIGRQGNPADFTGDFSFKVDLTGGGAISDGRMSGVYDDNTGSPLVYDVHSGTGTISNGNFTITGFQGSVYTGPAGGAMPPNNITSMTGSGNITNVGGTVSGTYYIDGVGTTGWTPDAGTFAGRRIQ